MRADMPEDRGRGERVTQVTNWGILIHDMTPQGEEKLSHGRLQFAG
jgi:hypothetical protein